MVECESRVACAWGGGGESESACTTVVVRVVGLAYNVSCGLLKVGRQAMGTNSGHNFCHASEPLQIQKYE